MASGRPKNKYEKLLGKMVVIPCPPHGIIKSVTIADGINFAQKANMSGLSDYAAHLCEKILEVVPKYAPGYFVMASALLRMGNKKRARESIMQGLEYAAGDADCHVHAGQLLGDMYENALSFSLIEKAYKLEPGNARVLVFYANMLEKKGREQEAISCLQKAIAKAPSFAGAYLALSLIAPEKIDATMCETLQTYSDKATDIHSSAQFLFAAARGYAKVGELDKEFACLTKANTKIRKSSAWKIETDLNDWEEITRVFSCEFLQGQQVVASSDIRPVIFATLPRSGTTLAEQILSSHDEVCAAGESNLFQGSLLDVSQQIFGDRYYWKHITAENFSEFVTHYGRRVRELMSEQNLDKLVITDKSMGNYLVAGLILAAFPKAKVIHCVRDPLDVTLSCYQHYFQDGLVYTCDLQDMAKVCKQFETVMRYWKTIFPERIYTLNYESVVRDSEATLKPLFDFLNLQWDPECLNFYQKGSVVHTASVKQVQQPINSKGLARWKKYEKYLQPAIMELEKKNSV